MANPGFRPVTIWSVSTGSVTQRRGLSLTRQAFALRRTFPEAMTSIRRSKLMWTGILTPTPLSREYTVRVIYSLGAYPQVIILDPPPVPDQNGLLPHFYRQGGLCLHAAHEWDGSMLIVETIVPWTTEWLAHYELWKWHGQWQGDGDITVGAIRDGMRLSSAGESTRFSEFNSQLTKVRQSTDGTFPAPSRGFKILHS
jgi:hypothetical protein